MLSQNQIQLQNDILVLQTYLKNPFGLTNFL